MNKQPLTIQVSDTVGSVSAELMSAEKNMCIMTLAHGAGAGMNHVFMVNLAEALAEEGIATLRFNFPSFENKKGRPDVPAVAHKTVEAAINQAHELMPDLPLFVGGKSFGGRMSSQYLSTHAGTQAKGIIFYGFPLHPPGKPSTERAEHLKEVKVPMLFLQGTRDELAKLALIEPVCSALPNATLIKIEGADHGFKAGKKDIMSMLKTLTREWIENLLG